MDYPSYNQRDPSWAEHLINGTGSSLGHYGCTVTILGEIFGKNPPEMEQYIASLGGFVGDLVWWVKLPHFVSRFYCTDVIAPIDEIVNNFRSGKQVLLNVHLGYNNSLKPNHWVLMVSEDFEINDPWTGDRVSLASRYGPPCKAILGGAYFEIPQALPAPASVPTEFPKEVTVTLKYGVRVREEANTASKTVQLYNRGTVFTVIGEQAGEEVTINNDADNIHITSNLWYQREDGRFVWKSACS